MIGKRSFALKIQQIVFSATAAAFLVTAATISPMTQAQQDQSQPSGLAAQFQKIEDQWSTAVTHQDQFTLETILAPSFVDISSTGETSTLNEQVADLFEKGVPHAQTLEQKVDSVRVIEDVAIVDGTYAETTKLNGVLRDEQGVYSHIYQRLHNVWMCVQSQRTAVPLPENESKKAAKKAGKKKLRF